MCPAPAERGKTFFYRLPRGKTLFYRLPRGKTGNERAGGDRATHRETSQTKPTRKTNGKQTNKPAEKRLSG
eukprot:346544-Prorocentrum_minimum.AAC.3